MFLFPQYATGSLPSGSANQYHRLDLVADDAGVGGTCELTGLLSVWNSSTIKLSPRLFNSAQVYLESTETKADVKALNNYFNSLGEMPEYLSDRDDLLDWIQLTSVIDDFWFVTP